MIELRGAPASTGLARGRLVPLRGERLAVPYIAGTPIEEKNRLENAIANAKDQLSALIAKLDDQAAEIIEFQLELLDDDSFAEAAFDEVDRGGSALRSWIEAIDEEIGAYRSGSDEYLSARADDVADLKGRVVRALLSATAAAEEPGNGTALPQANNGNFGDEDIVLIADQLSPSQFLELDLSRIRGIATAKGSPTSHVSILARARGIPMIVGCGDDLLAFKEGEDALLDADRGVLSAAADATRKDEFARKIAQRMDLARNADAGSMLPARTASGESVRIHANLDTLDLLGQLNVEAFDGVGLVRTEFLFEEGVFPSEDEQYRVYRRILAWAAARPVTVRTLDVGGDKPIEGLTIEGEQNPFLGLRGIRLFQYRPDVFRTQLRALARAAVHGELKVMAPMVSVPAEMAEFRAEMHAQFGALRQSGVECRLPRLGMMVEVPSAALTATEFETDFYSIGTNDLIQYTLAAARDEYRLNYLARGDNAAVLSLIERVATAGRAKNVEVSVCGDMASDPAMIGHLLQAGIRDLSVAPASVAMAKQAVRQWPAGSEGE